MGPDPSVAFEAAANPVEAPTGLEPILGGALREKAVWVDEAVCIGCRYCAHVCPNTFLIEPSYGRSRAVRQDGETTSRLQEAIDTCPVDCIHWVPYESLAPLQKRLEQLKMQPLGLPSSSRLSHHRPAPES